VPLILNIGKELCCIPNYNFSTSLHRPGFSIASAQYVPFKVPFLTVNAEEGTRNLTETYTRVAIADPGQPINGVYLNLGANNGILDFKVGETIQLSGLDPAYFSGLMLKVFLVKGNVVKIPSGTEFLNINFTGIREVLFSTNDLEASQINFEIPTKVAKDSYTLVIMTGEEELHYYTSTVRVN
jgi:hypothetical protein